MSFRPRQSLFWGILGIPCAREMLVKHVLTIFIDEMINWRKKIYGANANATTQQVKLTLDVDL